VEIICNMCSLKKIKDIYSDEELKVLLKHPDTNEFVDIRVWVIINTLLATGE